QEKGAIALRSRTPWTGFVGKGISRWGEGESQGFAQAARIHQRYRESSHSPCSCISSNRTSARIHQRYRESPHSFHRAPLLRVGAGRTRDGPHTLTKHLLCLAHP